MSEGLSFMLNLNPDENRYLKLYGLFGNPFDYSQSSSDSIRQHFLSNLKNGLSKKDAKTCMKRAGMSSEATSIIMKYTEKKNAYRIKFKGKRMQIIPLKRKGYWDWVD